MRSRSAPQEPREFTFASMGMIAANVASLLLSAGTITTTATLFFVPLTKSFGWSQTQFTGLFAASTYACAIAGFFLGRAADKVGTRWVIIPAAIYTGLALMGLSLINGSYWQAFALFALAGAGASTAVCYFRLMALWFRGRLGLALSVVAVLNGLLSGSFLPKLYQFVFEQVGWRTSFLIWGLVYLLVALPLQVVFARDPKKPQAADPSPQSPEGEAGATLGAALRTREIWLIFWLDLFAIMISTGLRIHIVPLFQQHGFTQNDAVNTIAISALVALAIRLVFGWCVDRFDTPRIVAPFAMMVTIGLLSVIAGGTIPLMMLGMCLLTAGTQTESGIGQYFLTRYYGRKHYGQIVAVIYVATPLGIGVGPLLLGILHDRTQGYGSSTIALLVLSVLCLLMLLFLRPYVYPAVQSPTKSAEGALPPASVATANPLP